MFFGLSVLLLILLVTDIIGAKFLIMADHMSLCTDRLITSESLKSEKDSESLDSSGESSSRPQGKDLASSSVNKTEEPREYHAVADEEEPLIQSVECRICQEEDTTKNLEAPCACNGSLKVKIIKDLIVVCFDGIDLKISYKFLIYAVCPPQVCSALV